MIHRVLFDTFEQAEGFYQGVDYCSDYTAWPPSHSRHGYWQVILDLRVYGVMYHEVFLKDYRKTMRGARTR